MALENINVHGDLITFTDRTPDDFTASVAITIDELGQILLALDADRYDEVIALAEQVQARRRIAARFPNLAKPCPFCHDTAPHDAEWAAVCANGLAEQRERELDRKADREDRANRRREMRQEMRDSYAR